MLLGISWGETFRSTMLEHIGTETSTTSMQISLDTSSNSYTYRRTVLSINFYLCDLFDMIQILIIDSIKTFTNSSE